MASQTLRSYTILDASFTDLTKQLRETNKYPAGGLDATLYAYSTVQIRRCIVQCLTGLVAAGLRRAASAALGSRLAVLGHLTLARVTRSTLLLLLRLAEIVVCRRGFKGVGLWSRVLAI